MPETKDPEGFLSQLESLTTRFRSLHTSHELQKERIKGLEAENAELHRTLNELSKCMLTVQNAAKTCLQSLAAVGTTQNQPAFTAAPSGAVPLHGNYVAQVNKLNGHLTVDDDLPPRLREEPTALKQDP